MTTSLVAPRGLKASLLITDIAFLAYWAMTALVALGVLKIPTEYLYSDYHNPLVVAWNWSFMPLDIGLSLCGLLAFALLRRNNPTWKGLAIVSLSLTFCAGLMAIGFWAIRGDFDPTWWAINLALLIWPLFYLPALIRT